MGLSIESQRVFSMSTRRFISILLFALSLLVLFHTAPTFARHLTGPHAESAGVSESEPGHQHGGPVSDAWEGSAAGIAYSERNHHVAGLMVMLMALAELSHAMRLSSLGWARL